MNDFIKAINGQCSDTVSVYVDGIFFAQYSRDIGYEVFDDIKIKGQTVDLIDDSTGEILQHKGAEI